MRSRLMFSLLVCTMTVTAGCGASLRKDIDIPVVRFKDESEHDAKILNAAIFVDEFMDVRENKSIAIMDEKLFAAHGDLQKAVSDAIRAGLRSKGFSFTDSAPIILSGEIRKWVAKVHGSFPTQVNAECSLFVQVLDPANKRIYSGVYDGFADLEASSISEKEVGDLLASSLEQSVTQVISDKQLVNLLASY